VHGLGVSVRRDRNEERLVVEPGFAIDATGEEIEVADTVTLCLPHGGPPIHVVLVHAERPTRPAPGNDEAQFTRIEEGFAVRLEPSPAGPGVALARLVHADGGWRVDHAFAPPHARCWHADTRS
jgi:hypothetical protein